MCGRREPLESNMRSPHHDMFYVQCTVVHRAARIQLVLSYSAVESDLARAKSVSAVAAFESVWARVAESHTSHWYTALPDFDGQGVEQSGQAPGIPEDWEAPRRPKRRPKRRPRAKARVKAKAKAAPKGPTRRKRAPKAQTQKTPSATGGPFFRFPTEAGTH